MEKKHIEFIIDDLWANAILDEIEPYIQRRETMEHFAWMETNDAEKINELQAKIEERYYFDEDLDTRERMYRTWFHYQGKADFFNVIREEQVHRKTRKKIRKVVKQKAEELGLW